MAASPPIGALRRRLIIEEPVETPDGAGGFRRTWRDLAPVWAEVRAASTFDSRLGRTGQSISHRITLRWRDDLTTVHRMRDGTRLYSIRSIHDATGEKRFLTALTEEFRP
jgi:SPP1 family predicted phage head-tail adaptor